MTDKTIVDIVLCYTPVVFVESLLPFISTADNICSEFQSLAYVPHCLHTMAFSKSPLVQQLLNYLVY